MNFLTGWGTAFRLTLLAWLAAGPVACAVSGRERAADSVRVVTAEQLRGCVNVGSTDVVVVDGLAELEKVKGGVAARLIALAKNSAVQLGGNAIVEMSNIDHGSQSFALFKCP